MEEMYVVTEERGYSICYNVFEGVLSECEDWMKIHTQPHPLNKNIFISKDKEDCDGNGNPYTYVINETKEIWLLETTTGGSPSASITYYEQFASKEEAEKAQASFREEEDEKEEDHPEWWHRSRLFEIAESDLEYWLSRSGRQ